MPHGLGCGRFAVLLVSGVSFRRPFEVMLLPTGVFFAPYAIHLSPPGVFRVAFGS